jgi:hypothetical protein
MLVQYTRHSVILDIEADFRKCIKECIASVSFPPISSIVAAPFIPSCHLYPVKIMNFLAVCALVKGIFLGLRCPEVSLVNISEEQAAKLTYSSFATTIY